MAEATVSAETKDQVTSEPAKSAPATSPPAPEADDSLNEWPDADREAAERYLADFGSMTKAQRAALLHEYVQSKKATTPPVSETKSATSPPAPEADKIKQLEGRIEALAKNIEDSNKKQSLKEQMADYERKIGTAVEKDDDLKADEDALAEVTEVIDGRIARNPKLLDRLGLTIKEAIEAHKKRVQKKISKYLAAKGDDAAATKGEGGTAQTPAKKEVVYERGDLDSGRLAEKIAKKYGMPVS